MYNRDSVLKKPNKFRIKIIKPLIWSFSVKEFIDKESNTISYFGNINSRLTAEKIVDSEINIAEFSGKFSLDAQWASLDNLIRISSKESIFNQPYNRLSSNLSFGRFLEVQIGIYLILKNILNIEIILT